MPEARLMTLLANLFWGARPAFAPPLPSLREKGEGAGRWGSEFANSIKQRFSPFNPFFRGVLPRAGL